MKPIKPTILIVDDVAINIQILSGFLKDEYCIKVATSGEKGIDIALNYTIDLILLDINMPGMDGYQVCRMIKANEKINHIPIIFVTAKSEIIDEEIGFNLGAVDYIAKPFYPTIVKVRVRNQVNLKLKTDLLAKFALHDGLTQIPNRRYSDKMLPKLFNSSIQFKKQFAIVMLDIDNFKAYNDNYGHGVGDLCLIQVASALNKLAKEESIFVARYGGEEFIAILTGVPLDEIISWAKKVVNIIADLRIGHNYSDVASHITISAGVAVIDGVMLTNIVFDQVVTNADKALYKAKSLGRNQVVVSA